MDTCKSAATGEDKERYATEAQAQHACAEFTDKLRRKGDREWQRLNVYYCGACDCWHVGRRSAVSLPEKSVRLRPRVQPQEEVKITLGEVANQKGTALRSPVPLSKVASIEATDGPSVVFHDVDRDAAVGQNTTLAPPTIVDVTKETGRQAAVWMKEKAIDVGYFGLGLGVLAGEAVVRGFRNWLNKSTPGK
ncbi:MAG: hypothetical protein WCA19_24030 [Candidatus Acidiferrales bacterium]